ncbi:/ / hypothetical protein / 346063:346413 Reverse [Candidatus Hepatoplasma crinochetorum]|uniref:SAP domain-containing protein n=1 Tax=Candidatus Hepatoplasma crinochetorum TaxID=295596 RepID=A0A0G7ZN09_9MOLU|nr:/ / hypothetical protein / 346063:346413 Reverse [Candidatus Hepatoplasma crinochetorum]
MDTATALVISLIVISVLTILILIVVNVRIFLIRKKYSTKKDNIDIDSKNLKENKKDNLNIEKNSIINKNIDNQFILKEEKDYYDYFNLLSLNDLKKALINLEINFNEEKSKEELIFLLLEKLKDAENEKRQ